MNIFIVDISGRVVNYDLSLHNALNSMAKDDEVTLFVADSPKRYSDKNIKRLRSLVPQKLKTSENILKRALKAIETIINYIYVALKVLFSEPDIVHFQWLPFMEVCSLEKPIIKMIRLLSPRTKMVLTIHNIYPHDYSEEKKDSYKNRFINIKGLFDLFVVHTNKSKDEVVSHFNIDEELVRVVHHGVFTPDLRKFERTINDDFLKVISYGHQDPYKGTDLIIDAISKLPEKLKNKVHLSLEGRTQPGYYEQLIKKGENLNITWKPYFIDDDTLYQDIVNSDVIIVPYRAITQSGVLLLALNFDKPIICSDLPAFQETLVDYPKELFFETDNADSLRTVFEKLLDESIDKVKAINTIKKLRKEYSWEEAAKKTINAYNSIS